MHRPAVSAPTHETRQGARADVRTPPSRERALTLLGFGAATLLVFWPALRGDFVWDDTITLRQNTAVRTGDFATLMTAPFFVAQIGFHRPVSSMLMSIAWQVGGLTAVHALALVAHALTACIVFQVAVSVLGTRSRAALATLVFLWHPVQVESVAWASAVCGPIAALFSLLSVRSILQWRDANAPSSWPWRAAFFWIVALFTKESAAGALPILFAVAAWTPGRTRVVHWWRLSVSMAASFTIWLVVRMAVLAAPFGDVTRAIGPWRHASAPAELLVRHLLLLVSPWPMTAFHPFAPDVGAAAASAWIAAAMATLAAVVVLLRRARPVVRIGTVFVVAPVLPHVIDFRVAGLYPLAERYVYVATVGVGLLLAAPDWRRWRWMPWMLAIGLGATSFAQTFVWRSQRSLVEHAITCSANDPLLHAMRGDIDLQIAEGDGPDSGEALVRARSEYAKALELAPAATDPAKQRARANATLGSAWCELLAQQGRGKFDGERLLTMFRAALACDDTVPVAWVGVGVAEWIARGPAPAEVAFRRALTLDERCAEAWYYLGKMQFDRGDRPGSRANLERALACNPDLLAARDLLAQIR